MSRKILCQKCGELKPMHPEDVMAGLKQRRVVLERAKKPANHHVRFYTAGALTEHTHLASLLCDNCGDKIEDGQSAVAVTMWRGDDEPRDWEKDYQ